MTTTEINHINVYWDTQDPNNEGWAYSTTGGPWNRDITSSGPIDGVANDDLDNAVAEACRILDCGARPAEFAKTATVDGGYAYWTRPETDWDDAPPHLRFSADGAISIVWHRGEALRSPTQADMDTLDVGPDLTDDEIASLPE